MINSRKKVIAQIAKMEEELNDLEDDMGEHKEYLEKIMSNKLIGLMILLTPAFMMGWNTSKMLLKKPTPAVSKPKPIKHHTLKLLEFGLMASLNHFRKFHK